MAKAKGKPKIKAKKAKKPGKSLENITVERGSKKGPKADVVGHGLCAYSCWYCGAVNWVSCGCGYFNCWNCWALNWVC